jgi:superoxide dismutase, Cu-Zn family
MGGLITMQARQLGVLALVVAAAACQRVGSSGAPDIRFAVAEMRSASGVRFGTLTLSPGVAGVRIDGALTGVPAGVHGIHFHQVGRCDGPDFTSAGPHLNPSGAEHGLDNPRGPHAGDLPNVTANVNQQMIVDMATSRVRLSVTGAGSLFDADGTALVMHADADDQRTDPAGSSGERIACGVITRS